MTTLCLVDIQRSEMPTKAELAGRAMTAVAKELGGHYNLVPAQHRAANNVRSGVDFNESIRRAVSWARSAFDPNGPRVA
jgi:hypothetical protein